MARIAVSMLWMAFLAFSALACENDAPCDKCAKDSEMSWNPDNRLVSERLSRFYAMDGLIKSAYEGNNLPVATGLANEYLQLASVYKCNWNYGNAIHDANRYLGLISLRNGDQIAAVNYLSKSGKTSGSPQLNSFGPEMDLADALLQAGHTEAVKGYLEDIKTFWKMENGKVDEWLAGIGKGERPTLHRFPPKPGAAQVAFFWFALAWPALAVAGCFYIRRRRLARKVIFSITGLVAGYVAFFAVSWGVGLVLPGILGAVAEDNSSLVTPVVYASVGFSFVISLLAVIGASQIFLTKKSNAS